MHAYRNTYVQYNSLYRIWSKRKKPFFVTSVDEEYGFLSHHLNIWKIKGNDSDNYNLINETSVVFTPNIPQNDAEIVAMAKNLYGVVSEQTIFEMLEQVTGVNAEAELKRMKEETEKALEMLPRIEPQGDEVATDEETEAKQP